MKASLFHGALALLLALLAAPLAAAPLPYKGFSFEAQVVQSNGLRYREFSQGGQATLHVRPNEEYSIVVYNPLPVRAAVAVSVDGLNSIDGKRSSPGKARKWMIDPHGSVTIAGWQTGSQSLRKFVFTQDEKSYAQWREGKDKKPYSRNIGVIGVAWFWNAQELDRALHPPKPFDDEVYLKKKQYYGDKAGEAPRAGAPAPASKQDSLAESAEGRAGTGMGREQQNAVTEVEFNANDGMYKNRDVLKIFYEFAKEPETPQPFVSDEDEDSRFAPVMK